MQVFTKKTFPVLSLAVSLTCGLLWVVFPGRLTWPLLLVALLPWLLSWRYGRFPFPHTPFVGFLLLFVATAAIGVVTAYDRGQAWGKFWIIIGALLVFWALAVLPRNTVHWGGGMLWGVAAGFAVYFLLTHNWQQWPTDFSLLTRLGSGWMGIRPSFSRPPLHPNLVGGIIAAFAPLGMAWTWHWWARRAWGWLSSTLIVNLIVLLALLLTSSRAAWVALGITLMVTVLWWGSVRLLLARQRVVNRQVLAVCMVLIVVGVGFLPVVGIMAAMSGPNGDASRFVLYQQTWALVRDFSFTGAGLATFGGLYAQYIQVVPHFLFSYAHNLFLDIWLEQGIVGFLSFLLFMLGVEWMLCARILRVHTETAVIEPEEIRVWQWAVAAAIMVMLLHGLLDDSFYGTIRIALLSAPTAAVWSGVLGTPLFLALPGLAIALSSERTLTWSAVWRPLFFFMVAFGLAGGAWRLVDGDVLFARWYANQGALALARVELAGWPTGVWDDGHQVRDRAAAAAQLTEALQRDPNNTTAQYRLGLIAMTKRDYETAVSHLEMAHHLDPKHRGITKNLGYSYVWLGDLDKAATLLADIAETHEEMDAYSWWWQQQGRTDLSDWAMQMAQRFP